MFESVKAFISRNSVFIVSLAAIILVSLGAILAAPAYAKTAEKESFIGDELACNSLAMTAQMMAVYRDKGVKWEQAKVTILSGLNEVKGTENSYVKTDADVKSMYQLAELIWATQKAPEHIAMIAFVACMDPYEASPTKNI